MNAEELLEKYKAGERTFKELNLRGWSRFSSSKPKQRKAK